MKKSIHVGFGIPTLMLIFTILCLSVFALFSYISGYSSYQHALKYEQSVTSYYESYEKVMKIKIALEENQLSSFEKKDYNMTIKDENITYQVSMHDSAYLDVVLDHDYNVISIRQVGNYNGDYDNANRVY